MTNEERDELHAALEAAGCHRLASRVCYFDDPMVAELRSLLRREVWVASVSCGTIHKEAAFSTDKLAHPWLDEFKGRERDQPSHARYVFAVNHYTIDAEVPDDSN